MKKLLGSVLVALLLSVPAFAAPHPPAELPWAFHSFRFIEPAAIPPQNTRTLASVWYDQSDANFHATIFGVDKTLTAGVGSLTSPGPIGGTTPSTGAFTSLSVVNGITTGNSDPNLASYNFLGSSVFDSYNYATSPDDVMSCVGKNTECNFGLFVAGLPNRVAVLQTLQQGTNGGIEKFWSKSDGGAIGVNAQVEGNAKNLHVLGTGGLFVDTNCTWGSGSGAGCDGTAYNTLPTTMLTSPTAGANPNDVLGVVGSTSAANMDWYLSGAVDRKIVMQANIQGTNGGAMSVYAKQDGSSSVSQVVKWAASPSILETVFGAISANTSVTATTFANAATYQTATNCAGVGTAANPSVAACGSAAAGHFSCATNASTGTCQVNTTAVTANSEIFVFESDTTTTGTALGVTCNTSTTVNPATRMLASWVAGTSFTINLGTVTTNPACFSYLIYN